ncbi:AbrB family transcriptional regulator, partial [Thioclava sp. BHET1]
MKSRAMAARSGAGMHWVVLILGGLIAGQALQWLGVPAGLMLGPLAIGSLMAQSGSGIRVDKISYQAAQGIVGCLIATRINADVFAEIGAIWQIVLLFIALTLVAAALVGFATSRLTGVDREVSIWGFLPGMAGAVIAMADDRGL